MTEAESDRVGVKRVFPFAPNGERRTDVGEDHSKILMLSMDDDSRSDVLSCGEALDRPAGIHDGGLGHLPGDALTELSVSRELLAALTDHNNLPQVLIRVGVAPVPDEVSPATSRRLLADVLRLKC